MSDRLLATIVDRTTIAQFELVRLCHQPTACAPQARGWLDVAAGGVLALRPLFRFPLYPRQFLLQFPRPLCDEPECRERLP